MDSSSPGLMPALNGRLLGSTASPGSSAEASPEGMGGNTGTGDVGTGASLSECLSALVNALKRALQAAVWAPPTFSQALPYSLMMVHNE